MRHAKIVCTMGPACSEEDIMRQMLEAGMNCARMNFSHGTHRDHARLIRRLRRVAGEIGRSVAILQDLQGPKIRTGLLEGGEPVELVQGQKFSITIDPCVGDKTGVSTTYKGLVRDLTKGSRVLIDDGRLELVVRRKDSRTVQCEVVVGGELGQNKGINLPGIPVSAPSMSKKDWEDLAFGLQHRVNFVAMSFVRSAKDVRRVRRYLGGKNEHVKIIAKIERPEALDDIENILDVADGIMVARGDLGVEIDPARVAIVQKDLIRRANERNKFVITATHMLDSMIVNPRPTRAEISDVSNAIFDGSDAVMLSGETASGKYPVRTVKMMSEIITAVERDIFDDVTRLRSRRRSGHDSDMLQSLVSATCHASNMLRCGCLGVFTTSGRTAWHVSKGRPFSRIIAFTTQKSTFEALSLAWGVHPIMIKRVKHATELYKVGTDILKKKKLARKDDTVLMIAGTSTARGSTNTIRFQKVT